MEMRTELREMKYYFEKRAMKIQMSMNALYWFKRDNIYKVLIEPALGSVSDWLEDERFSWNSSTLCYTGNKWAMTKRI